MLSRRHSHPRLRHFLHDFGKCRFDRFPLCFPSTHSPDDFRNPERLLVNLDQVGLRLTTIIQDQKTLSLRDAGRHSRLVATVSENPVDLLAA